MTDRYVTTTGLDTNGGTGWADAYLTIKKGWDLTSSGDRLFCDQGTYTLAAGSIAHTCTATDANPAQIFATNDTTNEPPQTMSTTGVIIDGAASTQLDFDGNYSVFGPFVIKGGTGTLSGRAVDLGSISTYHSVYFEDLTVEIPGTHTANALKFGGASSSVYGNFRFGSLSVKFSHVSQGIQAYGRFEINNLSLDGAGSVPTALFELANSASGCVLNGDLSSVSGELVTGNTAKPSELFFDNCQLHASVTPVGTTSNAAAAVVYMTNCAVGDVHYEFAHYNFFGNTTVSASIYANDAGAAKYDGTNGLSWKVTGTNATLAQPYYSPWINVYHNGTSAITPNIEVVRSGSATAYQDDEVWLELTAQDNTSTSQGSLVSDRMTPLGTPANQTTGALGASDWTGESATAWFGKLVSPSVTPAEIGHLRARVVVAGAITDLYVDPTIRGRT